MKRRGLQVSKTEKSRISVKLTQFLNDCEARRLSERTIEQYQKSIEKFINICGEIDVNNINKETIVYFMKSLRTVSPGTANYYLRGLRAFVNFCELPVKVALVKEPKKEIIPFTDGQVKSIFNQVDRNTFVGKRDYAILQMLYDTGIRVSELTGIRRKDILNDYILVKGKGNKERIVPIGITCQKALADYLKYVDDIPEDEPIFITENNLPINRNVVYSRLKEYANRANIKNVRVSPHTFRHTFARKCVMSGTNPLVLQSLLGHESLEMVRRYTKLFAHDIVEEHARISPSDSLFHVKKTTKRKRNLTEKNKDQDI